MAAESAGSLFVEGDTSHRRGVAVLVLHGSEGQRRDLWARQFAAEGFDAMAITWFGEAGIVAVPLEVVRDAAAELSRRTGKPVALAGHSKGAELALTAAALGAGSFAAVLAWAPSSVVWYGFNPKTWDPADQARSSWSLRGADVPFLASWVPPRISERGTVIRACYERVLVADDEVARAAIPIERFDGAVFLAAGSDDQMWHAAEMLDMLTTRLGEAGRSAVEVQVPGAGHLLTPDLAGSVGGGLDMGGSPEVDRAAADRIWARAVDLLGDL